MMSTQMWVEVWRAIRSGSTERRWSAYFKGECQYQSESVGDEMTLRRRVKKSKRFDQPVWSK